MQALSQRSGANGSLMLPGLKLQRAEFSSCGLYRYRLWREWGDPTHRCAFVMLNPSTADDDQDDPTVRRCIQFAKDWGFGALDVANIFAYRSTDPKALYKLVDPIGPNNDAAIKHIVSAATRVIVAWGLHGKLRDRGVIALQMISAAMRNRLAEPLALKVSETTGQPYHPLYLSGTLQPFPIYAITKGNDSRARAMEASVPGVRTFVPFKKEKK